MLQTVIIMTEHTIRRNAEVYMDHNRPARNVVILKPPHALWLIAGFTCKEAWQKSALSIVMSVPIINHVKVAHLVLLLAEI